MRITVEMKAEHRSALLALAARRGDFLSGVKPVAAQIASYVAADQLQTTAVTCFELLSGAGEGKRGDAIRRLLAGLPVLALDREADEQAAFEFSK